MDQKKKLETPMMIPLMEHLRILAEQTSHMFLMGTICGVALGFALTVAVGSLVGWLFPGHFGTLPEPYPPD